MPITQAADFAFVPQVASDHVTAYFEKQLVMGAFAVPSNVLKADAKAGETVTMPFYKKIGAAEEPLETGVLSVDKLQDDSFTATVKEIGKAVGFTDASLVKNGDSDSNTYEEATKQVGQVFAEKVDADLITEVFLPTSHVVGYNAAAALDVCNVQNILRGKINAFGDKQFEAKTLILHSQHLITFGVELFNKMIIKDANDPYAMVPGFMGRILDMVVIVNDQMPQQTDVAGKKVYAALAMKDMPYGYITKKDMNMESDRDILARQNIMAATQWYAVKSYHAKIAAADKRVAVLKFASELNA